MKTIIQKINSCELFVNDKLVSSASAGLLVFVGIEQDDTMEQVKYLAKKIATMRLFKDENDKTNLSVLDTKGDIMLVSNFTLLASITSGTRPSFSRAGNPNLANELYLSFAKELEQNGVAHVATGKFKTHMHLKTELDGPFTIALDN